MTDSGQRMSDRLKRRDIFSAVDETVVNRVAHFWSKSERNSEGTVRVATLGAGNGLSL